MESNDLDLSRLQPIDALDPTIHSPTRMKILALLAIVDSADFTFLLTHTGLTRGNLSPNLRKLEDAAIRALLPSMRIDAELLRQTPARTWEALRQVYAAKRMAMAIETLHNVLLEERAA